MCSRFKEKGACIGDSAGNAHEVARVMTNYKKINSLDLSLLEHSGMRSDLIENSQVERGFEKMFIYRRRYRIRGCKPMNNFISQRV